MTWPSSSISTADMDAGTDSPATARAAIKDAVDQLNNLRNWFDDAETGVSVGSTVDAGGQATNRLRITGTPGTAITSMGGNYSGQVTLRFTVSASITHHATSLICPGGVNMAINAGDVVIVSPKASTTTADGWVVIPAPGVGRTGFLGGVPDALYDTICVGRADSANEGGQIAFCRSSDNARAWAADVYYNGGSAEHVFRILDLVAGASRMSIDSAGRIGVGGLIAGMTSPIDVNGDSLRIRTPGSAPTATAEVGDQGTIIWTTTHIYVCVAANTWRRVALSTF